MNIIISMAIPLFILMDFIGTIPVLISLTQYRTEKERIKIAIISSILAGIIVLIFGISGNTLLNYFDISLEAVKIGGGLLLLYIAFEMILSGKLVHKKADIDKSIIVSPLAIPMLAGPGSMSFALLSFLSLEGFQKIYLVFAIILATIAGAILLSLSSHIHRIFGQEFTRGLEKITAIIISFIALEMIISGIQTYFFL